MILGVFSDNALRIVRFSSSEPIPGFQRPGFFMQVWQRPIRLRDAIDDYEVTFVSYYRVVSCRPSAKDTAGGQFIIELAVRRT